MLALKEMGKLHIPKLDGSILRIIRPSEGELVEIREGLREKGDYAVKFLDYFDSLGLEGVDVLEEVDGYIFPGLGGFVPIGSGIESDEKYACYTYEVGLSNEEVMLQIFHGCRTRQDNYKFAVRFNKDGLVDPAPYSGLTSFTKGIEGVRQARSFLECVEHANFGLYE